MAVPPPNNFTFDPSASDLDCAATLTHVVRRIGRERAIHIAMVLANLRQIGVYVVLKRILVVLVVVVTKVTILVDGDRVALAIISAVSVPFLFVCSIRCL